MKKEVDPTRDYLNLKSNRSYMNKLFTPTSIALIGASERESSVGRALMLNLINKGSSEDTFNSKNRNYSLFPVNHKKETCFGIKCYSKLSSIPYSIDLAIIATPAETVVNIVKESGEKKVPVVLIISSGFKEAGKLGIDREQELVEVAKMFNIRILGPNCLGFMNVNYEINAMFAGSLPKKGTTAFLSQSGALCTTILDWAKSINMGFSTFVSVGSMSDICWVDLLEYVGNDDNTNTIIMYIESIGNNASEFISIAREVALRKPIIVLKAGKSSAARVAAVSHTGSIVGNYDSFLSVMKSIGVLVIDTIDNLLNCASFLDKMPIPKGPKLMIITNAGGPAVLAVDSLIQNGGEIATLKEEYIEKLSNFLPNGWSHCNPIDILGDADEEVYLKTVEVFKENLHDVDGLLIILSPQDIANPLKVAEILFPSILKIKDEIPVICTWMGAYETKKAKDFLNNNGIYVAENPDNASKIFSILYKYSRLKENMYRISKELDFSNFPKDAKKYATEILEDAIKNGDLILNEYKSKKILEMYGISVNNSVNCSSEEEVLNVCKNMKFPIVCKLISNLYSHKSDIGGVILNINDETHAVDAFKKIRENVLKIDSNALSDGAFIGVAVEPMLCEKSIELILGSSCDFKLGPLILFGSGGIFVEIFRDTVISLPIFDECLAKRVIKETKIYSPFNKVSERFPKVDIEGLALILMKFSKMVVDLSQYISECDINPLMALDLESDSNFNFVALDAHFTLRKEILSKSPVLIRSYPYEYIWEYELFFENTYLPESNCHLKNIQKVQIRPIYSFDESELISFHKSLLSSKIESVEFSDNFSNQELCQRINLICNSDYNRRICLISKILNSVIIGISRIDFLNEHGDCAIIYIAIIPETENSDLLSTLLERTIYVAKKEGIRFLRTNLLRKESKNTSLMRNVGFLRKNKGNEFYYELSLN